MRFSNLQKSKNILKINTTFGKDNYRGRYARTRPFKTAKSGNLRFSRKKTQFTKKQAHVNSKQDLCVLFCFRKEAYEVENFLVAPFKKKRNK